MIRLIFILAVIAALALAATFFADNPGSVQITWGGATLGTSAGVGVILFLAAVAVAVFFWEVFKFFWSAPVKLASYNARKRREQGYEELTKGLVAAAAGDVKAAKHLSELAERDLDDNTGPLLLQAQAAQLEGEEELALVKFEQMTQNPKTKLLGLRGLMSQAIKDGDNEEALRLVREAYKGQPSAPWVMTSMFDLASRSGHWREARVAVDDMERAGLLSKEDAKRQRAICKVMGARALVAEGKKDAAFAVLSEAAKLAPEIPAGAVEASQVARDLGKMRAAKKVIEGAWRVHPHPELAQAYMALADGQDAAGRLKHAKPLKILRNDHAVTHMTLADLAIEANDKALAKTHLAAAVDKEPTARALRMWADLERATGDRSKADELAQRAENAADDKAWVSVETGEVVAKWTAFAPNGDFDGLRWTQPPVVAQLLGAAPGSGPSAAIENEIESPAPAS